MSTILSSRALTNQQLFALDVIAILKTHGELFNESLCNFASIRAELHVKQSARPVHIEHFICAILADR